ncbi:MAG: SufS family cysteine desulfurase [Acidimicrobiia bacterium]|nr:SufS family cysteine desulfurase [Acidimicrobiia bacterium]
MDVRRDFPILNSNDMAFLDSAASSQKPEAVIAAMDTMLRSGYANVHRGAYRLSAEATDAYEAARAKVAAFIGASSPREVIFTRGTTTAMNMLAAKWGGDRLVPGDNVVLSVMEHHANLVPWQFLKGLELRFANLTDDYALDMNSLRNQVDERTRIISITGMSNVLGTITPIDQIRAVADTVGATVIVDGAQLVPHLPVDVQTLGADFLAFSAHKMLGPTGIGVLWGRMELLDEMEPFEGGGEMIDEVGLFASTWAPVPHKFEAGTPPIVEAIGLGAAVDYLTDLGMDAVRKHDTELTIYALEQLATVPHVTVYGPTDLNIRGGTISFTLGDIHPHDLSTILDENGVAVRAGHHCARPLMDHLGIPATARASFSVYSSIDEVDRLVAGLELAAKLFGIAS